MANTNNSSSSVTIAAAKFIIRFCRRDLTIEEFDMVCFILDHMVAGKLCHEELSVRLERYCDALNASEKPTHIFDNTVAYGYHSILATGHNYCVASKLPELKRVLKKARDIRKARQLVASRTKDSKRGRKSTRGE